MRWLGESKQRSTPRRDEAFMIIARTDARAVEDFDRAVERSRRYLEAGADAIFPEALQNADEFKAFASEVKAPLLANMTEFGRSPLLSFQELRISVTNGDFSTERIPRFNESKRGIFARSKKDRHASGWIEKMQTRGGALYVAGIRSFSGKLEG